MARTFTVTFTTTGKFPGIRYGTIQIESHGTIQKVSYRTIQMQSHGTIQTVSYRTIQKLPHGTIQIVAYGTIQIQSHGTIQTVSYRTIQIQYHGTIQTVAYGTTPHVTTQHIILLTQTNTTPVTLCSYWLFISSNLLFPFTSTIVYFLSTFTETLDLCVPNHVTNLSPGTV